MTSWLLIGMQLLLPIQSGSQVAPGDSNRPQFMGYTAPGKTWEGTLDSVEKDWTVRLKNSKVMEIAGNRLVSLRQSSVVTPAFPGGPQVVLANGNRVIIDTKQPVTYEKGHFTFHASFGAATPKTKLKIPRSRTSLLWLQPPKQAGKVQKFIRRLHTQSRTRDVLLLKNGDRVEGIFVEMGSGAGCKIKVLNEYSRIAYEQIAAVALNTIFVNKENPKQPYGHLVLRNGTRLSVLHAELGPNKTSLIAGATFGTQFEIPLPEIVSIATRNGPAVYLSELKPSSYKHTPFFGLTWPFVEDGCVTGLPMIMGGETYDKGIGMHSQSRISYSLDGKYSWFEAAVGIDDHAGKFGTARIHVLVDGKKQDVGLSKEITMEDPPHSIRLSVANAKQLTLFVEHGSRANVQSHVNWGNARLIE